nr:RecName: Full=Opsin Rh3; AltName: Full=Inner R7 photoreceptor cells opsin [Drosophila virilis]
MDFNISGIGNVS